MENVLFKQSFMGFDRRQVLEYINHLSARAKADADACAKAQKDLELEIRSLSEKLSQSDANLQVTQQDKEKMSDELETLKRNSSDLKKRINIYRNLITEKDKEISQIKAEYNTLSRENEKLSQENRQWKTKQDEIASCMVEASVRAKQIIEQANRQAQQTKAEFDNNAGQLMAKVADMKIEISRLEQQLEVSFEKLSDAMHNMDSAATNIENQVKEYRRQVSDLDMPFATVDEPIVKPEILHSSFSPEKIQPKKTLTESVLDTISKLLEK